MWRILTWKGGFKMNTRGEDCAKRTQNRQLKNLKTWPQNDATLINNSMSEIWEALRRSIPRYPKHKRLKLIEESLNMFVLPLEIFFVKSFMQKRGPQVAQKKFSPIATGWRNDK